MSVKLYDYRDRKDRSYGYRVYRQVNGQPRYKRFSLKGKTKAEQRAIRRAADQLDAQWAEEQQEAQRRRRGGHRSIDSRSGGAEPLDRFNLPVAPYITTHARGYYATPPVMVNPSRDSRFFALSDYGTPSATRSAALAWVAEVLGTRGPRPLTQVRAKTSLGCPGLAARRTSGSGGNYQVLASGTDPATGESRITSFAVSKYGWDEALLRRVRQRLAWLDPRGLSPMKENHWHDFVLYCRAHYGLKPVKLTDIPHQGRIISSDATLEAISPTGQIRSYDIADFNSRHEAQVAALLLCLGRPAPPGRALA